MLDYRIYTFVKLCELMNYRLTAEALNLTQPAVTQHIQMLERQYSCKLFSYDGRVLKKTDKGILLEKYARSAVYNEEALKKEMSAPQKTVIRIGATKTVGDYMIGESIAKLAENKNPELLVVVENTRKLLEQVKQNKLDFAIVEGHFNRNEFDGRLFKEEEFLGICHKSHPFCGREIDIDEILQERIILREEGSGTRDIFEHAMNGLSLRTVDIQSSMCISSMQLIQKLVSENKGISFVYKAVAESDTALGRFYIKGLRISHEIRFVHLKNSGAERLVDFWQENTK